MLHHLANLQEESNKSKREFSNCGDKMDRQQQSTYKNLKNAITYFRPKNSSKVKTQIQETMNSMLNKDLREETCQQIFRFFYTSATPFNCVNNPKFAKMLALVTRHGLEFKPPSYHKIRETYLKKEVFE